MKLISTGINGNILRVIHNLYAGAKSCVKLNGSVSSYFNCNVGVRQGENLSPLLFAIFLNDFEYCLSKKYDGLSHLSNDVNELLSDDDVELFIKLYTFVFHLLKTYKNLSFSGSQYKIADTLQFHHIPLRLECIYSHQL